MNSIPLSEPNESGDGGSLELRAEGLAFRIAFGLPDGEGWTRCDAEVEPPEFSGNLRFEMLLDDLEEFRAQLVDSLAATNWPREARLASTEEGIDVSFRVEHTGRVVGEYRFGHRGFHHSWLAGTFVMDQTYLRPWLDRVDRLLSDLS